MIIVALAGVIGRVVFRRPWIVFARGDTRLEWPVVGYFNSRRRIQEIAGAALARHPARARAARPAMTG